MLVHQKVVIYKPCWGLDKKQELYGKYMENLYYL